MQTKRLGGSDLEITPIGLGAWAMEEADGNSAGVHRRTANRLPPSKRGLIGAGSFRLSEAEMLEIARAQMAEAAELSVLA